MSRVLRAEFLLAVALLLVGCSHPENFRWSGTPDYQRSRDVGQALDDVKTLTGNDWKQSQVTVYAFATPSKDASALTVKDLSDHGQAAFIHAMTQPNIKPDDIRAILANPSVAASKSSLTPKKVQNRFDRTLVATVTKGLDARPGDRLMWTWILVKPSNFKFDGYTVLATDNEILNIEHIQNQTTSSLQGQASASLPAPANPSVGITANVNNQYTTSADINQQYVKNSVDIIPNFLRVYRESERNLDVAGNTLISLSVVTEPDKWHDPAIESTVLLASNPILSKSGMPLAPADATIDIALVKRPPHCPLTAQVRLVSQIRKITSNADSYVEGNQQISIEQHATPWADAEIVSADEVQPNMWQITAYDPGHQLYIPVTAGTLNDENLKLVFDDYETARNMAHWMMKKQAYSIGKNELKLKLDTGGISHSYPRLIAMRVEDPKNQKEVCAGMHYHQ